MTEDEAQRRDWAFYEAVRIGEEKRYAFKE